MSRFHPALLILILAGCAKSIEPEKNGDTGNQSTVQAGEAVIDATSETEWVYLDIESASMVTPATPEDSPDWDMAFRRYKVSLNGGVSGTGGMEIVPMPGADYNQAIDPPESGWITDAADADGDGDLEYAFDSWFAYDTSTHRVTAADIIYVVQTVELGLFKLEFLEYYDAAGTPGYIQLHWGPLDDTVVVDTGADTGTEDDGITCTAETRVTSTDEGGGVTSSLAQTSGDGVWVCFDLGAAGQVTEQWDLAMHEWTFVTTAQVAVLEGQDFDTLSVAPADGYVTDDGTGSALEDWYDYNPSTHTLDPADVVYVVHTADDAFFKLQFLSYYLDGDTSQADYPNFRWAQIAAPAR